MHAVRKILDKTESDERGRGPTQSVDLERVREEMRERDTARIQS